MRYKYYRVAVQTQRHLSANIRWTGHLKKDADRIARLYRRTARPGTCFGFHAVQIQGMDKNGCPHVVKTWVSDVNGRFFVREDN